MASRIPVPVHQRSSSPSPAPRSTAPLPDRAPSPSPHQRYQASSTTMSAVSGNIAETRRKQSKRDEVREHVAVFNFSGQRSNQVIRETFIGY